MELIAFFFIPQVATILIGALPPIVAIMVGGKMSRHALYASRTYQVALTAVSAFAALVVTFLAVATFYAVTLISIGFPLERLFS